MHPGSSSQNGEALVPLPALRGVCWHTPAAWPLGRGWAPTDKNRRFRLQRAWSEPTVLAAGRHLLADGGSHAGF